MPLVAIQLFPTQQPMFSSSENVEQNKLEMKINFTSLQQLQNKTLSTVGIVGSSVVYALMMNYKEASSRQRQHATTFCLDLEQSWCKFKI